MTNRTPLTETQQGIYQFLVSFIRENKYPPTVREIQDHFGFRSTNSVVIHLKNLREKGYITKDSNKDRHRSRTLKLVDDIIGNYTIDGKFLNKAMERLKKRGYKLDANIAVEFLRELKVNIV